MLFPSWLRIKEVVVISLGGWIPAIFLGSKIRQRLYQVMFSKLGRDGYIQDGVDFLGASCAEIGDRVFIFRHARIDSRGPDNRLCFKDGVAIEYGVVIGAMNNTTIEIGEGTLINAYTCITGPGNVSIGQNCLIAPHCGIFANNHNYADLTQNIRDQGVTRQGIVIGDNCWLGHRVTVLDGVTIGSGSLIGAGAVVTRNIKKELWSFTDNWISVRFEYEWHDASGQWYRSHGNEQWEFAENGLMQRREASINDVVIQESERKFTWERTG
jgi:acetyltransferase-like isoleucine patch superfamily enzyme